MEVYFMSWNTRSDPPYVIFFFLNLKVGKYIRFGLSENRRTNLGYEWFGCNLCSITSLYSPNPMNNFFTFFEGRPEKKYIVFDSNNYTNFFKKPSNKINWNFLRIKTWGLWSLFSVILFVKISNIDFNDLLA